MNINDVIVKPYISEKSSQQMIEDNVYTFIINPKATKTDVKEAIEFIFAASNAKVSRVNISNYGKKKKRMGQYNGMTASYKKAIVYLSEGSIPIYGQDGFDFIEEEQNKKVREVIDLDKVYEEAEKEGNA